jgi:flagellin-specific chaperone FliS
MLFVVKRSIYLFAIRQLTQVALDNNTKHIDNVISIITKLKNAFEEILNNPDNEEALELNKKEQTQNCFGKMI